MRVVAIGAFHESFRDSMVGRQRELSLNRGMAGETELRLRFTQETLRQPAILFRDARGLREVCLRQQRLDFVLYAGGIDEMRGMAILARDAVEFVFGAIEQRLVVARDVAIQTAPGILSGLATKAEDQVLRRRQLLIVSTGGLDCRDVRFPRSMTTFAPASIGHVSRGRLRVRSFRELIRMDRMTADTGFGPRIVGGLSLRRLPDNGRGVVCFGLLLS
jgi:hypothetical protein